VSCVSWNMESEDEVHQPFLDGQSSYAADSRLEEVLSDTTVPCSKRLLSAAWIELNLLFPLAGPAILVYVINNLMSFITRAFAGHLGNLELAAANLGNSGIQLFAFGLMVNLYMHHLIFPPQKCLWLFVFFFFFFLWWLV